MPTVLEGQPQTSERDFQHNKEDILFCYSDSGVIIKPGVRLKCPVPCFNVGVNEFVPVEHHASQSNLPLRTLAQNLFHDP